MQEQKIITVATVLAQVLREAGIQTIFGLPGGENAEVMEAIRCQGMEFVLVRNESTAVYMADATARLTGKPGVCLTTLGPGATNAYAGVAHAWLDRAPVLVITAQSMDHLIGRHTHQVLDLQAIFRPVTKQTMELTTQNTRQTVEQALALTMAGRPGPVHLGISSETAALSINRSHFDNDERNHASQTSIQSLTMASVAPKSSGNEPTTKAIAQAKSLLETALRPIVVTGLGLEPEQPYAALQEFAEAAQAPVIDTPKSKGGLPSDHELFVGTIGLTRVDPAYEVIDEADCIVAIGFDVVELVKLWEQKAPLIWIAAWKNEDPIIAAEAEFVGSMTPVLEQLSDSLFSTEPNWGMKRVAKYRQTEQQKVLPRPEVGRLSPQSVLQTIRKSVPRDTLVTTDVGSHKICTALSWPAYTPNRYLVSNGLSAMGFGLTAAAAAAKELGTPTIAITGDAGLGMVLGELNMITQWDLPVIIVVMNDNALDLIRSAQRRTGKPAFGTEFTNPDFLLIAQAYGLDAYRVSTEDECMRAIQTALSTMHPTLIDAQIDPISYPTTPQQT